VTPNLPSPRRAQRKLAAHHLALGLVFGGV
jgi:hypothetical protein